MPLPYAWLVEIPPLSLLRKADRFAAPLQLVVAMLVAFAWRDIAQKPLFSSERLRWAALCASCAVVALELTAVPLQRFDYECSPTIREAVVRTRAHSIVHMPANPGSNQEGRYDLCQTSHAARIPQGYVTSLALSQDHLERGDFWRYTTRALALGNARPLDLAMRDHGIDLVVLHKTQPTPREPLAIESIVWSPFFWVRHDLLTTRQVAGLVDAPVPTGLLQTQRRALRRAMQAPIAEDDSVVIFELRGVR